MALSRLPPPDPPGSDHCQWYARHRLAVTSIDDDSNERDERCNPPRCRGRPASSPEPRRRNRGRWQGSPTIRQAHPGRWTARSNRSIGHGSTNRSRATCIPDGSSAASTSRDSTGSSRPPQRCRPRAPATGGRRQAGSPPSGMTLPRRRCSPARPRSYGRPPPRASSSSRAVHAPGSAPSTGGRAAGPAAAGRVRHRPRLQACSSTFQPSHRRGGVSRRAPPGPAIAGGADRRAARREPRGSRQKRMTWSPLRQIGRRRPNPAPADLPTAISYPRVAPEKDRRCGRFWLDSQRRSGSGLLPLHERPRARWNPCSWPFVFRSPDRDSDGDERATTPTSRPCRWPPAPRRRGAAGRGTGPGSARSAPSSPRRFP